MPFARFVRLVAAMLPLLALGACGGDSGSSPGGAQGGGSDTTCKANCGPVVVDTSCTRNCVFPPGPSGVLPATPLTPAQLAAVTDSARDGAKFCSYFGMERIRSKGQTFWMGLKDSTWETDTWAYPQHKVGFTYDFYIDRGELTVGEFCRVANWAMQRGFLRLKGTVATGWLQSTGSNPKIVCPLASPRTTVNTWKVLSPTGTTVEPRDLGYNYSMGDLTYDGARVYANLRSMMLGLEPVYDSLTLRPDFRRNGFRLPTEAEFEFALRAGSTETYFWGLDQPDQYNLRDYCRSGTERSNAGGNYPNPWGLYDMICGEDEWLEGRLVTPYPKHPALSIDPILGQDADSGDAACYTSARSGDRHYCPVGAAIGMRLVLPASP